MSAAEMQACLARLYVDDAFRELFLRHPDVALDGYVLDDGESRAVQSLDPHRLELFATSLRDKRKKRMLHAYPAFFALDHPHVERLYRRYHTLHATGEPVDAQRDIISFGRFAERSLAHAGTLPPYVAELVRYERLAYTASFEMVPRRPVPALPLGPDARPVPHPGADVAAFDHDVAGIEAALLDGDLRPEATLPLPAPRTLVFRHRSEHADHRILRVDATSAAVIASCDGDRALPAVVEQAGQRLGVAGTGSGIVETVERLVRLHVLDVADA